MCLLLAAASPETCRAGTLAKRLQNFQAPQNAFFLHQSQFGSCHGRIKILRFTAFPGGSSRQSPTVIYVSFWRPSGSFGQYKSIGKAAISSGVTNTAEGYFEYNAMSDNITVQPGDRMGVWQEGPTPRLLYASSPNSLSLYMPLNPMVRAAALGTTDVSVFFRAASSRETAIMEVEVLLPTSGTVNTPSPSMTVGPSSLVPSTSSSLNQTSSASLDQSPSTSLQVSSSARLDISPSTSLDQSSSSTPLPSTSNSPLLSSTLLPIATSVLSAPSSSITVTKPFLSVSTMREPPLLSTVTPSPSSVGSRGVQGGVEEFPLVPVAAGAAGGLLLVLVLCVCVVLCTLLRQWKVKGRPFKSPHNGGVHTMDELAFNVCTHMYCTLACAHQTFTCALMLWERHF